MIQVAVKLVKLVLLVTDWGDAGNSEAVGIGVTKLLVVDCGGDVGGSKGGCIDGTTCCL